MKIKHPASRAERLRLEEKKLVAKKETKEERARKVRRRLFIETLKDRETEDELREFALHRDHDLLKEH